MKKKGIGSPNDSPYLSFGAIIPKELTMTPLPEKIVQFQANQALTPDNQAASSFFSMCFSLFNFTEKKFIHQHLVGGFSLSNPTSGFSPPARQTRPAQTDNKCCLVSFENAKLELSESFNLFFENLYHHLILPDLSDTITTINGDSVIFAQQGPWGTPHAHIVDTQNPESDFTVSYGVNLNALCKSELVFDFFTGNFMPFLNNTNLITKTMFHGKYLHQTVKQTHEDKNIYFFFIYDGVRFKNKEIEKRLISEVLFERWISA